MGICVFLYGCVCLKDKLRRVNFKSLSKNGFESGSA